MNTSTSTMEVKVTGDHIDWMVTTTKATLEEAEQISAKIKQLVLQHKIRTILVDNTQLTGVWNSDVQEIWSELMGFFFKNVGKVATVCNQVTGKMQLNRLSNEAGTFEVIRAFTDEKEALEFLEGK